MNDLADEPVGKRWDDVARNVVFDAIRFRAGSRPRREPDLIHQVGVRVEEQQHCPIAEASFQTRPLASAVGAAVVQHQINRGPGNGQHADTCLWRLV